MNLLILDSRKGKAFFIEKKEKKEFFLEEYIRIFKDLSFSEETAINEENAVLLDELDSLNVEKFFCILIKSDVNFVEQASKILQNSNVRELILETDFDYDQFQTILKLFHYKLTNISISFLKGFTKDDINIEDLIEFLQNSDFINSVKLKFTSEVFVDQKHLFQLIEISKKLTVLSFDKLVLGDQGIKFLSQNLANQFSSLTLIECHLTHRSVDDIKKITKPFSLMLNLSKNQIGEGALDLFIGKEYIYLNLDSNNITRETIVKIFQNFDRFLVKDLSLNHNAPVMDMLKSFPKIMSNPYLSAMRYDYSRGYQGYHYRFAKKTELLKESDVAIWDLLSSRNLKYFSYGGVSKFVYSAKLSKLFNSYREKFIDQNYFCPQFFITKRMSEFLNNLQYQSLADKKKIVEISQTFLSTEDLIKLFSFDSVKFFHYIGISKKSPVIHACNNKCTTNLHNPDAKIHNKYLILNIFSYIDLPSLLKKSLYKPVITFSGEYTSYEVDKVIFSRIANSNAVKQSKIILVHSMYNQDSEISLEISNTLLLERHSADIFTIIVPFYITQDGHWIAVSIYINNGNARVNYFDSTQSSDVLLEDHRIQHIRNSVGEFLNNSLNIRNYEEVVFSYINTRGEDDSGANMIEAVMNFLSSGEDFYGISAREHHRNLISENNQELHLENAELEVCKEGNAAYVET